MTGQIPDIIEKISAARDIFFRANGFMPNVVKMNMADYRATLELGDPNIHVGLRIVKRAGEMECAFEPSSDVSKPDTNKFFDKLIGAPGSNKPIVMKRDFSSCRHGIPSIDCTECSVAPRIDLRDAIKRDDPTGGYGTCVHGNDFMTCAKCIPPIAKREFSGVPDTIKISMVNITPLAEWFRNQTAKEFEKLRFKFEQRMPEIGECGLIIVDNQTLFVTRTSQNYFHSYGYLVLGSMQIPIERAGDAVTLVRIDPSIEGDESVDQSTNSLKTGFRF